MGKRTNQAIFLIIVILFLGIIWSMKESYQKNGFTASLASSFSTLALVVLTGWYAHTTSELLDTNKNQVEAARASYMPALDVDYDYDGELLALDIRNRGQGVARNVAVLVSIVGRGVDTYQLKLPESLPPQYSYVNDQEEPNIEFEPRFYTDFTDKPMSEILELKEGPDEVFPEGEMGRSGGVADSDVENLYEYMDNIGTSKALYSPLPSSEGSFEDAINRHTEDRPNTYSPAIYLQVVFTDVMYGQTHQETVLDGVYTDPSDPSFTELLPGDHTVTTRIPGKVKKFREVHGDIVKAPIPYVEEMDVDISSNEPSTE